MNRVSPYFSPSLVQCCNLLMVASASASIAASEHLLGYVHGAEPLPGGAWELDSVFTYRFDKDQGTYNALDVAVDLETGVTDRFTVGFGLKGQAIDTNGLIISGYLPEEVNTGLEASGMDFELKFNVLSPAKDAIGLTLEFGGDYAWIDNHSGQDKNTVSVDYGLALQKYFFDGELVWVGNIGQETTIADRKEIKGLNPAIEWPTDPEVEVEVKFGTGLSYRIIPKVFIGAEILYETEFEMEVFQERWTIFAGPSVHYASQRIWLTLSWLPQLEGGGEFYDNQSNENLHLVEKTRQEIRLRAGYTF